MLTQNQGQPWTPSTAPLGVSADAEQAERQKVVAQVRAIMATPEQSREFPADGDPAQWARSIMAVAERQPVEQTFLRGLEQGWVGTAGTLARSARLPYEAGKAALEWLGLDKEDLATVEVALRAITPGSFAVGDYLEGRGQALQEQAALLGQTFEKETMLGGVGQAFGSAFAMAPAAVVGGAVAPALGVSAALGGAVAGGATGVALSSEGLLERAEALGASPGQKLGAMAAGVPIGAVEAFGAQRFLGALGKVFGAGSKEVQRRVAFEIAKAAARSGAEEGLEEVAQGMGEEAVAQFILEDPEKNGRSLTEWAAALEDTVVDQGFPGAVVGMVLGGMARAGTLTQAVKEAEQKPAVAAQEPKPEPAAEDDAERANAPEWAGPLEAMAKQNNARLRYVKPSNDAQRQAMRIAEDLGVEVGFVDVAPDPAGSGQLPGQTAPAAAAVDVAPPDVATDTAADMREPGEDAAPVEAGPPKSIRDRMADRKALAQDGSLGFRNWVRSMGGLNAGKSGDVGAEIREGYSERESGEGAKWGLGPLVHSDRSDKGMSLDGLLEAAMEAGFVPQGSGIQDVLDLLESDVTPQSAQYQAERDLAAEAELFDRELERERKARGLPPGTTAQDIADIDAFTGDAPPFAASPTGGLKFPAAYMNGRVVLDARSATPKRLLFHEGLHHIAANNPEGFARLLSAMTDMRPEKIAAARRAYAEAFGEGAPEGAALDEEAAAVFSEDLAGVLETAFTDTTKLARVLQDRNVFEVVRDWIARLARTLGGSMQTTMERRLAAAVAADNAEVQLALLWKDAVDMIQAEQRSRDAVEAVEGDAKFAAAYHGTPHDFDRFTTEKIGTGEGAQAYGWGLYFASAKEVAESYRKKLTNPGIRLEQVARDSYNSDMETDEAEAAFLADVDASPGLTANERALVAQAKLDGWYGFDYPHQAIKAVLGKDAENYDLSPEIRPILDAIKAERRGRLYEVELAPAEDEYLLWDEPLSSQSEKVRRGLAEALGASPEATEYWLQRLAQDLTDNGPEGYSQERLRRAAREFIEQGEYGEEFGTSLPDELREAAPEVADEFMEWAKSRGGGGIAQSDPGSALYRLLSAIKPSERDASMALRSAGIRGIKYLDGMSRGAGDGSYNYVIFDEADVSVRAKFAVAPPTDSPEFKRWFGDSKVVDAQGRPMVVYHGTAGVSTSSVARGIKRTLFLSPDPAIAAHYAGFNDVSVMPVYVAAKNVLAVDSLGDVLAAARRGGLSADRASDLSGEYSYAWQALEDAEVTAALSRAGFDAAWNSEDFIGDGSRPEDQHTSLAVWPGRASVKSATGNVGTFDPANPDIRFALDPNRVAAAQAQAQAEGEPTEVGTRPSRIADTSDDPEARAFRRGVREVRAENEEVLSLEEQRRRADELLKDPNAEADLSAKIETGDVLKGHEQLAFDTLRTRRTMAALKSGDMASIRRGIETEKLYEDMRRDTARALGVIRDALNEPTPQRLVSEFAFKMSPDLELRIERATKKLDEARAKGNADRVRIETATIERLKGIEAERVQKAIAALKAQGIDPALITSAMLEDPAVAARVARTIYTAKSPKFDWYKEYLISAMLSATGTQVVNATGNVLNAGVEQHATRLAKAMVNTVVRDQNSPSWDETYAFYKAWNVAAMKAGQVFLRSMRTDMPVFEIELRNQGVVEPTTQGQKLDVGRAAIPGMMGRIVRAPSLTMIRATDESARAFSFVTEGTALAFRAAKKEGLTGDALAKRTIEILEGPARPDVHGAALEMADHMTFRDPDGFATQAFLEVRKRLDTLVGTERHGFFPLGTHIAPFVSFAAKSLRAAVGLPVHPAVTLLRLAGRVGGKGPYVGDKSKMVDDLARTMVSSAIMFGLYALVGREDDDGLPYITGSARPGERDVFPPPMSVRVGGSWYSYERLDPASTSIALLVDGIRAGQDEDSVAAGFAKGMQSLGMVVADKSYLQTLGTIVDAISEPDAEAWQNRGARFLVRTMITPLVPNIIRATATATDPLQRTPAARKSAEDDGVWDVMAAELDYRVLPTGARAPAAKYDLWGRPLERPGRNFFERLLSPVKTTGEAEDATDFDVLIYRYNQRFERGEIDDPEARRFRTRQPDYHYTGRDGEKRYWTGPEYEALQQRAGQEAFERLQRQRFNFDAPTWDDVERIRKTVSEARSRVKRSLLREAQEPQFAER